MKKHRFTWIDGLVLAVVLLLVAGTFLKFFVMDKTAVSQETQPFAYQIKIEGVRQCTVDALQTGDTVFDNEGKGAVGVISAVDVTPAVTTYGARDGTVEEVEYENRYDVVLTLEAEGVSDDGAYKIGTYTLKVNQSSLYFTKYSIWSARIISID